MRVAIIGAGLLGVSSAYFLAESGHEVIVIDRRDGPGEETSFANGGMLTPSQSAPWNTPGIGMKVMKWLGREGSPILVNPSELLSFAGWGMSFLRHSRIERFRANQRKNHTLAHYSLTILKQLRQKHDFNYDQATTGTLKIYRDIRTFNEACNLLDNTGLENNHYQRLDVDEVIDLEPVMAGIRHSLAGGIYFPDDESGDAHKFCSELAAISRARGVIYRYQTTVENFIHEDTRITGLETTTGLIEADLYILSAGSFSPLLAKSAGIALPIKPVKGYSVTLELDPSRSFPGLPVIDESRHIAMTPLGNRLRIAGIAELAGHDASVRSDRIKTITDYVNEIYPGIDHNICSDKAMEWAGLRPYCCDGVPIIGRTSLNNLMLNTGHGHLGWTMAAGSARLLADLINNDKTAIDPAPYQLGRFS